MYYLVYNFRPILNSKNKIPVHITILIHSNQRHGRVNSPVGLIHGSHCTASLSSRQSKVGEPRYDVCGNFRDKASNIIMTICHHLSGPATRLPKTRMTLSNYFMSNPFSASILDSGRLPFKNNNFVKSNIHRPIMSAAI